MSKYEYPEGSMVSGWILEVRKDGSHKGNIRRHPMTGLYQFYRGSRNAIRSSLEAADLETLKADIEKLDL